jgi:hypothetical protein
VSEPGDNTGCAKCGLFGCNCDVGTTFDASCCAKCKSDPCECAGALVVRTIGEGVCAVCRRKACICESHVSVRIVADLGSTKLEASRPYSDAHIALMVNEAMHHYYNRDAEGLKQWLRRALP